MSGIRQGWAEWLGATEWNYFGTFTTPWHLTLLSARRLMVKHGREWCCDADTVMFWCAEEYARKTGYHCHALIRSPWRATDIWRQWFSRYGRARVLLYNPELGGAGYVAKYVTKRIADYDMVFGGQQFNLGGQRVREV